MTILVNGKQKTVERTSMIDGLPFDQLIGRNADHIQLFKNEMYGELLRRAVK